MVIGGGCFTVRDPGANSFLAPSVKCAAGSGQHARRQYAALLVGKMTSDAVRGTGIQLDQRRLFGVTFTRLRAGAPGVKGATRRRREGAR